MMTKRMETTSEHIARDMREGRFPKRSEPQEIDEPRAANGEIEERALEVSAKIEADLKAYDWRYMPATAQLYIAAALRAEREACARIAESIRGGIMTGDWKYNKANTCDVIAAAIRNKEPRT